MTPSDLFSGLAPYLVQVLWWVVGGVLAAGAAVFALLGVRKGISWFFTMLDGRRQYGDAVRAHDDALFAREMAEEAAYLGLYEGARAVGLGEVEADEYALNGLEFQRLQALAEVGADGRDGFGNEYHECGYVKGSPGCSASH